jgi:hypothetical protein
VPVRVSPGTKSTFVVDETAKALIEEERTKLLFLAKRARPDILTDCELPVYESTGCNYGRLCQAEHSTGILEGYAREGFGTTQSSE